MVEGLDETVAVDALSSLPESWQKVLWHVEVEGRKPAEVAQILDMRPGAHTYVADLSQATAAQPVYKVDPRAIGEVREDIAEIKNAALLPSIFPNSAA